MLCREPILVQSEVAHFKRIDYSGYADMLHNDLLEALDTEIAILRYAGVVRSVQALWFTGFIEVVPSLYCCQLSVLNHLPFRDIRLLNGKKCGVFDAKQEST